MGTKRQQSSSAGTGGAGEYHEDGGERPQQASSAAATSTPTGPAPKRQRVSRACDQCRSARERCDGIQPVCFPCASQNRACSWADPAKRRGVQTGYIRTLEMALGWLFDKIPGSEDALFELLTHEGGQGQALLVGKDTGAGTRLHRRWRRSRVHKEIDRVLSGGDPASSKSGDLSPGGGVGGGGDDDDDAAEDKAACLADGTRAKEDRHESGDSRTLGTLASISSSATERRTGSERDGGAPQHNSPTRTQSNTQTHTNNSSGRNSNSTALPGTSRGVPDTLPSNHWRLLDIFFSYTHIWFPVVEKPDVLKSAYAHAAAGQSHANAKEDGDSHRNSAGRAELWAALALASYQEGAGRAASRAPQGAAEEEEVATATATAGQVGGKGGGNNGDVGDEDDDDNDDDDDENGHHPDSQADEDMTPADMYWAARNAIPGENEQLDQRHINALLLLALVNVGHGQLQAAWLLTGTAARVALHLRLHLHLHQHQHQHHAGSFLGHASNLHSATEGSSRAPGNTNAAAGGTAQGSRRALHTYMGCFVLDTLLAARLGLPPHLAAHTAPTFPPPRLDDDLDEWQPWAPCPGFAPPQPTTDPSRHRRRRRLSSLPHQHQHQQHQHQHRSLALPSRSPAHTTSTFVLLYNICHVLSQTTRSDQPPIAPKTRDVYVAQLRAAVQGHGHIQHAALHGFVLDGLSSPGQSSGLLPSAYVARMVYSYVCARLDPSGDGNQQQALSEVARSAREYALRFGACASPPLFAFLMDSLLDDSLGVSGGGSAEKPGLRSILDHQTAASWTEVVETVRAPWTSSTFGVSRLKRASAGYSISNNEHSPYPQQLHDIQHSHLAADPAASGALVDQQLLTPISHAAGGLQDGSGHPVVVGGPSAAYHPMAGVAPMATTAAAAVAPAPQPPHEFHHPGGSSRAGLGVGVGLGVAGEAGDLSAGGGGGSGGDFGDAACLDYDALLDDIAASDGRGPADLLDSDPQFMANLGFLPGSNLSDLTAYDFMGFS